MSAANMQLSSNNYCTCKKSYCLVNTTSTSCSALNTIDYAKEAATDLCNASTTAAIECFDNYCVNSSGLCVELDGVTYFSK